MPQRSVLIFDNYDSFTYNLVHQVEKILRNRVDVIKNDEYPVSAITGYEKIIFSPGPGVPDEAGNMKALIRSQSGKASILGVCLGMQAIAEVFGARLHNLEKVQHGLSLPVHFREDCKLFESINCNPFNAGRYHSWVVSREGFPSCLKVIAEGDKGEIMAIEHNTFNITGVQFHPESILTPSGELIMKNWILNY